MWARARVTVAAAAVAGAAAVDSAAVAVLAGFNEVASGCIGYIMPRRLL